MNLKFILNFIIGCLIGICIGWYTTNSYNVVYHGPNSNDIKKWIWYSPSHEKYYKFNVVPYVCPPMLKGCVPSN